MAENTKIKPAPAKRQGHGHGAGLATEKPKNFGKSIKQIIRYSGNYKYALVVVIFLQLQAQHFRLLDLRLWDVRLQCWQKG